MVYSVIIIGGGFSGLCAGVSLGRVLSNKVLILEANKRVGKKILATGNGQGNITNTVVNTTKYHGDISLVEKSLQKFSNNHLIDFFDDLGLLMDERDGKIYPASYTASSVLDVLRFEIQKLNVKIETEKIVTAIKKTSLFELTCADGSKFYSHKVILAFGGKSGAGFFTDGKSYSLATSLGHSITKLAPSLVQLKCNKEKIKGLKGIKQEAKVGLYGDKRHIVSFCGDILFTDYGISGNSIFSLSAYLNGITNPYVIIEFLPNHSKKLLCEKLIKKCKNHITWEELLISYLPARLNIIILKECGLNHLECANAKHVERVVKTIKEFKLEILGTAGFENSQVTSGGLCTSEFDSNTLQSKKVKNLYAIGECLNVDGDCGGYNLQWAFTSAMIAAKEILDEES